MIGFNYRLPNINAALGCAQLEELPVFLAKKRALAQRYRKAFANLDGIRFFDEPDFACSNYWLNVLLLDEQHANHRDDLLEMTNADGIMTRPTWTLMHCLSMFRKCPRMDLGTAESLARRLVNIPSSAELVDTYAKA
jgi:perosamine synthetase